MALINTDTTLFDLTGNEIVAAPPQNAPKDAPPEFITLKTVIVQSLMNDTGDKRPVKEKIERYALALEVRHGGEVEMTSDQVTMCKNLISEQFTVLITGQAHKLLEGQPTGLEK